jgi:hypothetical protein
MHLSLVKAIEVETSCPASSGIFQTFLRSGFSLPSSNKIATTAKEPSFATCTKCASN